MADSQGPYSSCTNVIGRELCGGQVDWVAGGALAGAVVISGEQHRAKRQRSNGGV